MTAQLQGKTVIDPDLVDVLHNLKLDVFQSFNCVKVGEINSFDPIKKTAEVQLLFKITLPDGTVDSYSPIVDVPVFTLQGGGGAIQFPVAEGDQCIVLFSDRRLDEWFRTGEEAVPGDARMHDLSDGITLVGINALNSSLPTYPTDKVVLSYQGSKFELTATGYNVIGTGGAEIDLDTLVGIKNNATSLLICLTNLITALESLTVTVTGGTGVVSAATVAALTAVQNTLNTLLE